MAILSKGTTYSDGDQVTSSNLNALVDSATFASGAVDDSTTQLSSGKIIVKDLGVATGKIASAAVTTVKIADSNVTKAKIENLANYKILGNVSGGAAAPAEVALLDEDNMASNSATSLATQQSIKAYVDTQITAEDLDFAGDGGTGAVDLNSQTLTVAGSAGLDTSASSQTLTIALDFNEISDAAIANGDFIPFVDATDSTTKKEAIADIATLFAGTGLSASSSVLSVDASQTQITSVGTLGVGAISSGFGAIDNGSSAITTTGVGSFGSLDISGAVDVEGTTNLDAVDIDGAVDMATTLAVAGDANFDSGTLFVDVSENRVGVGTISPSVGLSVSATGVGLLVRNSNSSEVAGIATVRGQRSDTNASPAAAGGISLESFNTSGATVASEHLGSVYFGANHTAGSESNILGTASIAGVAEGTFSNATTMPSGIAFRTGSTGQAVGVYNTNIGAAERMRIDSSGNVGIGTASPSRPLTIAGDVEVNVVGSSNTSKGIVINSSGTNFESDAGIIQATHAGSGSLTGGYWLKFNANSADKFTVKGNGDTAIAGNVGMSSGNVTGKFAVGSSAVHPSIAFYNQNDAYFNGATTINGAAQFDSTLTVGVNDTGKDVKFFGATSGASMLWDESADRLCVTGPDYQLKITQISSGAVWYNRVASNGSYSLHLNGTGDVLTATSSGVAIAGALSKGSGSFKIPHPLESKKDTHNLVHSFLEGPQADLIYRGRVNLVDGVASVNIDVASDMTDGTFVILCRDVQSFTTNESGWTAVRSSVDGNILTIEAQDNTCTDSISWMVIGERQDDHMMDTDWTDENGKVIVEPLNPEKKEEEVSEEE